MAGDPSPSTEAGCKLYGPKAVLRLLKDRKNGDECRRPNQEIEKQKRGSMTESRDVNDVQLLKMVENLSSKIDQVCNHLEFLQGSIFAIEKFHSQKDKVFSFNFGNQSIKMYLPEGNYDFLQREIIRRRNFYQIKILSYLINIGIDLKNINVIDVGANIGNHSIFFSLICGASKVFAFDPNDHVLTIFKENITLNNLENIYLHNIALGSGAGRGTLHENNFFNIGGNEVQESNDGEIQIDSIDNLFKNEKVGFVKIDVEGMLDKVVSGAIETIKRDKPILLLEAFGNEINTIKFLCNNHNYYVKKSFGSDFLLLPVDEASSPDE
ncbi:FkbM family methyltransferase [Roseibium sp. FZY0029]|uniref:FkbM family methyltransferase n=1 Tax=Roseibium sp. FZY0029 TaxID=3116647 RepID=UPI002EC336ED|nr:FkbM family methyltransferase [Roseibium sp. FZY0029]